MPEPTLLYGLGATKAGTSWLYRHLHDHPACQLRAVKEAHYWDTFGVEARDKQVAAYQQRLIELHYGLAEAEANKQGWKVRNMQRRIADMTRLIAVLEGDRTDDRAYLAWLTQGAGDKLVADLTPNYAVLPDARLARMAALTPSTKFIYLMRDPIDRLWSHVRMQARRFRQDHEVYAKKANNILWRVVNAGKETHILDRGDYPATVAKLRRVIPAKSLLVEFAETLFTPVGLQKMSDFLGIPCHPAQTEKVHAGEEVPMRADLRPKVAEFLKHQYEWVAQHVGPLPQAWQDNLKKASA